MEKEIIKKLENKNIFMEKDLLLLYGFQTRKEQERGFTIFRNGRGFGKTDSFRLSNAARWVERGNHLKGKELKDVRKRMVKYSRQLKGILKLIEGGKFGKNR